MRLRFLPAFLCGFVLTGSIALSQNLVVGGRFDSGIGAPWTSFGSALPADGARSFSTNDSGGAPTSGSALMTLSSTATAGTVIGLAQCIDISAQPAGSTYQYFSSVASVGAQSPDSRGVVELAFFSDAGCTTSLNLAEGQGGNVSLAPAGSPPWPTFPGNASAGGNEGSATAPAGAIGLQVRIYLERIGGSGQQQLQFDSTTVHLQGSLPLTLTNFSAE